MAPAFDYVIVGAGAAGCVLAERLSADLRTRVCLIESGPSDKSPLVAMPKGFGKLLSDPGHAWFFPVAPSRGVNRQEVWARGRMLGGSSSINGMMYTRGDPAEYDAWAEAGCAGWGAAEMAEAFCAIEDHALGAGEGLWRRGAGGPLHVSLQRERHPACDAFLSAAESVGLRRKLDINDADIEGVGYFPRTIKNGKRWSAADAFLRPAEKRANLTVLMHGDVLRIVFDGTRACGVELRRDGRLETLNAAREIVLCAGALNSVKLLQLSGVGPAAALKAAGIEVRADRAQVGRRMREHRVLFLQYRARKAAWSRNRELRGLGLLASVLNYALFKRGVMALGAFEVGGFFKSRPDLARCDGQFFFSPVSIDPDDPMSPETAPGVQCLALPLRPISEGFVEIISPAPDAPLRIEPNLLAAPEDRAAMLGAIRFVRRIFAEPPLADLIEGETSPGAQVQTDEDLLSAVDRLGLCGYHAIGTCRMGADDDDVVDPRLRVRGVSGLRVMDCSVMPTMASGNTNGPVMAMAWRAADLIRADAR
ncbi:MAG: GMC family oxidoreductase N-terminal domain-containing protein [Hydrogenophilaceae bacterium]|jgi:choline dehydrogenase-like flavoprotein|nr:GMC family oxidoreductase N-terminal domain-containing protein [Hydrogenophilaceae bacterium]